MRVRADHEGDLGVELRGELAVPLDAEVRQEDDHVCSSSPQRRGVLPDERKPLRDVEAHRRVDVAPVGGREPDQPDVDPVDVEQHGGLRPRNDPAGALEVRGELRIAARRRLLDERPRPVVDDRPVADRRGTAPCDPEQSMDGDPLRQVAQPVGPVLDVAGVDIEHRVPGRRRCSFDQRRDSRDRVGVPVDVVRVEDDQPAHAGVRLTEHPQDLVVLRKAPLVLLREDERPVGDDVVLALRPLERDGVVTCLRQHGRETRGPTVVAASDGAVEDLDAHSPDATRAAVGGAR